MSILIKGMEMPESCTLCQLRLPKAGGDPDWCKALNCVIFPKEGRIEKDCPLIEVPNPCRLVDWNHPYLLTIKWDGNQLSGDLYPTWTFFEDAAEGSET